MPGKIVNCRNIWFREFWSQHHKCSFNANLSAGMTRCTGTEELIDYEQEGLVPFVGNKYFYYFRSQKLNFNFFKQYLYNWNQREGYYKTQFIIFKNSRNRIQQTVYISNL